jgi:REP element-mobilizing transposase RayT
MPDRKEGFVRRKQGILPPDEKLARVYRDRSREQRASFNDAIQRILLDEFRIACEKQRLSGHFMATDPSHLHLLVSWPDERGWSIIRNGLKQSFTRRLHRDIASRTWFSDGASRKQVKDREHFEHLIDSYLLSHRGWKRREDGEVFK